MRQQLGKNRGHSPLDEATYEYFVSNKGPWDRLKSDEPFIAPYKKKPEGAAFYPPDMSKEEFEKYVAAHPDQKEALQGLFTIVRRENGNVTAKIGRASCRERV